VGDVQDTASPQGKLSNDFDFFVAFSDDEKDPELCSRFEGFGSGVDEKDSVGGGK
jgi:hypothetical protein